MLTPMPVLFEMIHSIHCQTNTYILMLQATTAIYKKLFLLFYPLCHTQQNRVCVYLCFDHP